MNRLIILFSLFSYLSYGQELNCQVSIITNAKLEVTSVELEVISQLKQSINDLMNNTQWTKDKFKIEERINCQLQLQIDKIPAAGSFSGFLQIQSSRPAYNSSYNSLIFNFQDDDIEFSFSRQASFVYAANQYKDNLTSILAFYAYYIIGMDYDSFSLKGGTPYFTEAQQIVTNAQNSGASGWKSNEKGVKRNRYWLVDNALHQLFEPLRECFYEYHRKGIDQLYANPVEAKKAIFEALNKLVKVTTTRPGSVNLLNFIQAKQTEIKNIFYDSEQNEKTEIINLLKRIDPTNSSKYETLLN
ncbi:MAG: DUF4835 family protein [Flavobacteriia bacterium]|nr:DUF4835 family protein [Flavobacteriia bacterium]